MLTRELSAMQQRIEAARPAGPPVDGSEAPVSQPARIADITPNHR
jgi:hypothetical protein